MVSSAIPEGEYARRRQAFMAAIGGEAVAVVPAASERLRNRDVHYPFRQDSDFQYLTGFPEPDAVAVLAPGRAEGEYVLFCHPRDPKVETWTGRRFGPEGAAERFGADQAHPLAEIDQRLPELLQDRDRVVFPLGQEPAQDTRMMAWLNRVRARARKGARAPTSFVTLEPNLHEMRLRKDPAEVAVMREAARISAEAHTRAMRACAPGMTEYQIEAELRYVFQRHGAGWAYPSIVAGGANACVLHYVQNTSPLAGGELLLIDAGAQLDCYAADITRTFPIDGRFTGEQRAVYDAVLAAQHAAIAEVRPGARWTDPHDAAVRALAAAMVDLGLLEGEADALIEEKAYERFYMHKTGHWLGMDVHDVGSYRDGGAWRAFEPGMVTTIEPGLYIAPGSEGVDPRWWGIGVRIEDDVLVTEEGREVLSSGVPKDAGAIEELMRSHP